MWAATRSFGAVWVPAAIVLALGSGAGFAHAESGREAFEADCASCHSISGASTHDGPSLRGVVWRKVASLRDFSYSGALKSVIGAWTPQRLDSFLKDTQAFAPRGEMFFAVQDRDRRRAIVDYLKTLK